MGRLVQASGSGPGKGDEVSAVEEYRTALEYAASRGVFLTSGAVAILADAAIAELEAEIPGGWEIDLNARLEKRIAELEAKNERLLVVLRGNRGIRERMYRALKELDELAALGGGEG